MAEFFTRKDAATPLYGDVMTYAPFWCVVNFNQRFVSSANPNMLYFNEDGSANVNNEAGVRAFTEILENLQYHGPGALQKDWLAQYQLMGSGNGVQGGSFPNSTKIIPGNKELDTANVGQFLKTNVTPGPGRRRRADPATGHLLQHLLRRERVLRPEQARGHIPLPAVGRRRADVHVPLLQRERLPGSAPHLHAVGSVHRTELQAAAPWRVPGDRAAHGTADHDPRRLRVPDVDVRP